MLQVENVNVAASTLIMPLPSPSAIAIPQQQVGLYRVQTVKHNITVLFL